MRVITTPVRSPWANSVDERFVGSYAAGAWITCWLRVDAVLTGEPEQRLRAVLEVLAPRPAAEGLAVQFPDAGERHRVEYGHLTRVLVRRELGAGELGDLRRSGLAVRPQRHERHDLLAKTLVRPADDAGHRDRGMLEQEVLHVAREDVEAAADDEVLLPVHHVQVAVGVEVADVAGMQQAAAQGRRSLRGRVPVAGHHPVRADADLTVGPGRHAGVVVVADRDLVPGNGQPDRAGPACPGGLTEITAPASVHP